MKAKSLPTGPHLFSKSNLILAAVLGLCCVSVTHAQIFSFNFTGTMSSVFDPGTYIPDDIQTGQAISGTITYDVTHLMDHFPGDPTYGDYFFTG